MLVQIQTKLVLDPIGGLLDVLVSYNTEKEIIIKTSSYNEGFETLRGESTTKRGL